VTKIGVCPSCQGVALIKRQPGAWLALCSRCGITPWRAVFKTQPPLVRYS
jgi:hypothetical protein